MSTANVVIPVPILGVGGSVDVSALVGEKTVILSGRYQGAYVLYGSHDNLHFATHREGGWPHSGGCPCYALRPCGGFSNLQVANS